jgi:purine-binding chemotaxis protein CheW
MANGKLLLSQSLKLQQRHKGDVEGNDDGGSQSLHSVDDVHAQSYLTFFLREEVFGIDIRRVLEILPSTTVTQVPQMSSIVRGVINMRGAVVPVIDLNCLLGRVRSEEDKKSCIVILEATTAGVSSPLGVIVEAVSEVIAVSEVAIEPAPQFGASVEREFILGMVRLGKEFIVLLDPVRSFELEALLARLEQRQIT